MAKLPVAAGETGGGSQTGADADDIRDTVRGVDSSYAVNSLIERGLIESKSRLDAPGRPMLYTTTAAFLRCFGIASLEELPKLSESDVSLLDSLKEMGGEKVDDSAEEVSE